MPQTIHLAQPIVSMAAAHEAERGIQEWIANHAGPNRQKARKAISTQNGGHSVYEEDHLIIQAATNAPSNLLRRCSGYSAIYSQHKILPPHRAHGLIIFPSHEHGPGAISLVLQVQMEIFQEKPPWQENMPDPATVTNDLFNRVIDIDEREARKPAKKNGRHLSTLEEARLTPGLTVLLTPRSRSEPAFTALVKEHSRYVNLVLLTEAEQISMSNQVPDDWLRHWLEAKAILVKATYDPVDDKHPLTRFDNPQDLRPILDQSADDWDKNLQDAAQREVITAFMELTTQYNSMEASFRILAERDPRKAMDAVNQSEAAAEKAKEEKPPPPAPAPVQDNTKDLQRISTLEDQLQQEKEKNAQLDAQVNDLRSQVQAYEEYMKDPSGQKGGQDSGENEDSPKSREDTVLEAITEPRRFPHLRFLRTVGKDLDTYGKSRPRANEIIEALDAVNKLAGLYLKTENGNVGTWTDHFKLPGWTYANSESETTMGKHSKHRTFKDQEKGRSIVVQRHLTYRGSHSGFQIFFDEDGPESPFIVAYIGAHLPYARERS